MPTILIRDIRDMLISRYFHILSDERHWQYEDLARKDFEEGFMNSLTAKSDEDNLCVIDYYTKWIEDWFVYNLKNKQNSYLLYYEQMLEDLHASLVEFSSFYNFNFNDKMISKIIKSQKSKQINKSTLKENLNLPGKLVSTFRSGTAGGWKNKLTKDHKNLIKRHSGNMLINTGYEKDLNW
tara:strand:- start:97 stop:639 length:543 start_codon:yes stop_codon:yes gene_type:complete